MTDMTASVQSPSIAAPVTPTYTQCTAADKFSALPNMRYMLHYKNGGTPTGTIFINEKAAPTPAGSVPATPAGASKWSDAQVSTVLGASTERVVWIDNSSPFRDATGFINLQHVTPTTLTVAIFGPF